MKFWDLPAGHVQLVRRYFRNGEHHVVVVVDGQTKEFPSIFFDEVK